MSHVFDYTEEGAEIIANISSNKYLPVRYINNVATSQPQIDNDIWVNYGDMSTSVASTSHCKAEITSGYLLFSDSLMSYQLSCEPHAYNAGNQYNYSASFPSATNSICSLGWMAPNESSNNDYSRLMRIYGINISAPSKMNSDAALLNFPLSFLRTGYINTEALRDRGRNGLYRAPSSDLFFSSSNLNPTYGQMAFLGYSLRCVGKNLHPCYFSSKRAGGFRKA